MKTVYDTLLGKTRNFFCTIIDKRQSAKVRIPLVDHLMCGLGIFALKYPSLLQFDELVRQDKESAQSQNFLNLFGVVNPPDDTTMRQTLDEVEPAQIRPLFKEVNNYLKDNKYLESFSFYKNSFLLAMDGTGFFSSHDVNCENCCVKNHRDGSTTYHHQAVVVAMVHPNNKEVVPLDLEPIVKQDGAAKNDCERNATKRVLARLRETYPTTNFTITEDALSANYPHICTIKMYNMNFILGIKPGDHKDFFSRLEDEKNLRENIVQVKNGKVLQTFRFINNILLKEDEPNSTVNFVECEEHDEKGKVTKFTWITNFQISKQNVHKIASGGRARWRIENEVFNTLKNQGYQFEHNFGHGRKNLSTNFAILMLLAFAIDQASDLSCQTYQRARVKARTKYHMWEKMRSTFDYIVIDSWKILFMLISGQVKLTYSFDSG